MRAVSHTECAQQIGCSASNVRRLIASGALGTDLVRGTRRLTQAHVDRYLAAHALASDGATTARVFQMFRDGHELVEVTIACKLTNDRALALAVAFQRQRAIGAPGKDAPSPDFGAQLCARCNVDPARYCAGCAAPETSTKQPPEPPGRPAESAPPR